MLLLPTGYYVFGGAAAVAASFLALLLVRPETLVRIAALRFDLLSVPKAIRFWTSLASFGVLVVLLLTGVFGSRDPLSNPLPLTIWTLMWIGLTIVQGTVGNLWILIDPFYAPVRMARAVLPNHRLLSLPPGVGMWPAVVLLAAMAWFELIDPAPDDPFRLAVAAGCYWLLGFGAMLVFGHETWSRRGEFLSILFRLLSRLAIVDAVDRGDHWRVRLCFPGAKLQTAEPLPASGAAFLLLALGSVSFDGFSKTFFWLGTIGVNPLDYPGRTAMQGINTLGLYLFAAVLAAAFVSAVGIGGLLAGRDPKGRAGLLVWSIVPIALAYLFSHYLTLLLVNGQYAVVALSDPFELGWNLFGTAYFQVGAGIAMGSDAAWTIWNLQAVAIVGGHILAVLVARALAQRLWPPPARTAAGELPLMVLMVAYTVFGLWLLSAPTAG